MENGKDNIIARIAEDTEKKVSEILCEAESRAQQILDNAQQEVGQSMRRAEKKVADDKSELLRRAKVNVQMNCKKYRLAQKQQLVRRVFDGAKQRILALPREKYLAFCQKQLAQYAEKGEQLVICQRDSDILTATLAATYGLTLADFYGNFDGGFVLLGNGYEKNVTLETIIDEARLAYENDVVKLLFA